MSRRSDTTNASQDAQKDSDTQRVVDELRRLQLTPANLAAHNRSHNAHQDDGDDESVIASSVSSSFSPIPQLRRDVDDISDDQSVVPEEDADDDDQSELGGGGEDAQSMSRGLPPQQQSAGNIGGGGDGAAADAADADASNNPRNAQKEEWPKRRTIGELEKLGYRDLTRKGPLAKVMGQIDPDLRGTEATEFKTGYEVYTYRGNNAFDLFSKQVEDAATDLRNRKRSGQKADGFAASIVKIDDYVVKQVPPDERGLGKNEEQLIVRGSTYAVVSASARGVAVNFISPDVYENEIVKASEWFYNRENVLYVRGFLDDVYDKGAQGNVFIQSNGVQTPAGKVIDDALSRALSKDNGGLSDEGKRKLFDEIRLGLRGLANSGQINQYDCDAIIKDFDDKESQFLEGENLIRRNAHQKFSDHLNERLQQSAENIRDRLDLSDGERNNIAGRFGSGADHNALVKLLNSPNPHCPFPGPSILYDSNSNTKTVVFNGSKGDDTIWLYIPGTPECYVKARRYNGEKIFTKYVNGELVNIDTKNLRVGDVVMDEGTIWHSVDGKHKPINARDDSSVVPSWIGGRKSSLAQEFGNEATANTIRNCYKDLGVKAMSLAENGDRSISVMQGGELVVDSQKLGTRLSLRADPKQVNSDEKVNVSPSRQGGVAGKEPQQYVKTNVMIDGLKSDGSTGIVGEVVYRVRPDGVNGVVVDKTPFIQYQDLTGAFKHMELNDDNLCSIGCERNTESRKRLEEDLKKLEKSKPQILVQPADHKAENFIADFAKADKYTKSVPAKEQKILDGPDIRPPVIPGVPTAPAGKGGGRW